MKISVLNSILSCTTKCIRFIIAMSNKKIILGLFAISFLGACASPTAMLGPAYTLSSTGSTIQAGLTYGSNEMITMYTGKTPLENLKDINLNENKKEKNIHKSTLESDDFHSLIKSKIEKTRIIFK
jgi:hypothetical protein